LRPQQAIDARQLRSSRAPKPRLPATTGMAGAAQGRYTSLPMTATTSSSRDKPASGLQRYALPLLLLGAVFIACSPIFVRLSELGPIATAVHRVLLALPVLFLLQRLSPKTQTEPTPRKASDWGLLALAGFMFAGDLATWHWSVGMTTVANATLLANFAPIFVALFSWLVFKERFTRLFVAGLALAMIGAITLMGASLNVGTTTLMGDLVALSCGGFYAGYILSIASLRSRFDTTTVMLWTSLGTFLFLLPLCWIQGESLIAPTLYGWLILVGLAVISHAGGQSLIAFSLAHLPASFSSVALLTQPVVAAILAVLILGEVPLVWQAIGGVVVLFGIWLAKRGTPSA
jgi:drug/metabolite transporter (DMT)-like permease